MNVYRNNGSLRMYYCSKKSEPHRLMLYENSDGVIENNFNPNYFLNSIITDVGENHRGVIRFENNEVAQSTTSYDLYIKCLKTRGLIRVIPVQKRKFGRLKYSTVRNSKEFKCLKNEVEQKLGKMKERFHSFDLKCKKILRADDPSRALLVYFDGHFCPLDKKDHKHKNFSGRYGFYTRNKITIYCKWNPKCNVTNNNKGFTFYL
jgi:hypothetical protein